MRVLLLFLERLLFKRSAPPAAPASKRPPTPTEVSDGPPFCAKAPLLDPEHATPCAGFPWTQNVSVATTVSTDEFIGAVVVIVVVVTLAGRVEVTVDVTV